jgi:hypothetical protein
MTVAPKMLVHGPLQTKRYVKSGKTPKIPAEEISLTLPEAPAGGFTDYLQRKILDHLFGHLEYPSPATVYAGLGTALSGDNMTEWDDGAYSRQAVTFGAPSDGICRNSGDLSFTGNDGVSDGSATIAYTGIWDDDNAGHLLVAGSLRKSLTVVDTNLVKFLASQLSITLQ